MHRASLILLSVVVGLYCGFCHSEAVGTKEYHERPIQVSVIEEPTAEYIADFTDTEKNLMVRVVMSEVGAKDLDCKQAVAQTILNRLASGKWGDSIEEVIYYPNAYSTADNGEPNAECYMAVEWVISHPTSFPVNMYHFREGQYHTRQKHLPYEQQRIEYAEIDGTYFSTEGSPIWE